MTLQFNPFAYFAADKEKNEAEEKNAYGPLNSLNQLAETTRGIGSDYRQEKMAAYLRQLKQQEMDLKNRTADYTYGKPIDPNIMVSEPTGQIASSSFMPNNDRGVEGQRVASSSPLKEKFNSWLAQGMQKGGAKPEYMEALGSEERRQYQDRLNPKPTNANINQPLYAIPDGKGGYTTLPPGIKPQGFGMPKGVPQSAGEKEREKMLIKAKTDLDTLRVTSESSQGDINRLLELNKNSYGGALGDLTMKSSNALNMGQDDPRYKNTAEIVNTLKSLVIKVLKSSFGSQLSDAERSYLNEVYGAADGMSQANREIAIKRIQETLTQGISAAEAKYRSLAGGAGGQKIRVSNGTDTFDVDPSDLQEVLAEGFQQVSQ